MYGYMKDPLREYLSCRGTGSLELLLEAGAAVLSSSSWGRKFHPFNPPFG
ncbi:hypothetical protein LAUMK13_03049 [Mycobacterium innocens]|uniref:Uncharacterized protein n=1 Tax=Mycobacterium innocens TaxID=2341083 RepID=A0A498Q4Z8_9MYCO|nr:MULTISPECIES: hypothetical protein [Mycobacterium]VBA40417.1 hypothetical protein LAUMK13_03049 [Mycobacterium innocens]